MDDFDVVIVGAGASGLMAAVEAGRRGRSVLVLDHNARGGEKIRISGGGRANVTNREVAAGQYLSANPHFCKSALARYGPGDFLALLARHGLAVEEREHGQVFCAGSARSVVQMLETEAEAAGVRILTSVKILDVRKEDLFRVRLPDRTLNAFALVVASGGLSYPKLGASDFAAELAAQFGIGVVARRPGLVPLVLSSPGNREFRGLSGIALPAVVRCGRVEFRENILFTHRGVSGPAILQASSYWREGQDLAIDLLPGQDIEAHLLAGRRTRRTLAAVLADRLPRRFLDVWLGGRGDIYLGPAASLSPPTLERLAAEIHAWRLRPDATEGYGKAEVTVGGIDTREISSQTMESRRVPGLYFTGECLDVTGWLGGYNLQWAWSSGWAAGRSV